MTRAGIMAMMGPAPAEGGPPPAELGITTLASSGAQTSASPVVTFAAQPAGTLLLLAFTAEVYAGTAPPGWTELRQVGSPNWMGGDTYWRLSTGSESSVTYNLSAAGRSSYVLVGVSGLDASPADTSSLALSSTNPGTHIQPATPITPAAGDTFLLTATHCIGNGAFDSVAYTSLAFAEQVNAVQSAGDHPYTGIGYLVSTGGASRTTTADFEGTPTAYQMAVVLSSWKI